MYNQRHRDEQLSATLVLTRQKKNGGTMNIYLDSDYITEDEQEEEEEDTMSEDDNLLANHIEEVPIRHRLKPSKEQVLSQNLSQLSTSHRSTEHLNMVHEYTKENIPYYLSKESASFEQIINHVSSNDTIEELRQMAILI